VQLVCFVVYMFCCLWHSLFAYLYSLLQLVVCLLDLLMNPESCVLVCLVVCVLYLFNLYIYIYIYICFIYVFVFCLLILFIYYYYLCIYLVSYYKSTIFQIVHLLFYCFPFFVCKLGCRREEEGGREGCKDEKPRIMRISIYFLQ